MNRTERNANLRALLETLAESLAVSLAGSSAGSLVGPSADHSGKSPPLESMVWSGIREANILLADDNDQADSWLILFALLQAAAVLAIAQGRFDEAMAEASAMLKIAQTLVPLASIVHAEALFEAVADLYGQMHKNVEAMLIIEKFRREVLNDLELQGAELTGLEEASLASERAVRRYQLAESDTKMRLNVLENLLRL